MNDDFDQLPEAVRNTLQQWRAIRIVGASASMVLWGPHSDAVKKALDEAYEAGRRAGPRSEKEEKRFDDDIGAQIKSAFTRR